MQSATNSMGVYLGSHSKGIGNADLQQIEMGQSTDLTPLVSSFVFVHS